MSRCTFVWAHGLNSSVAHEDELGLFDWSPADDVARVVRYDARGHGSCEPSQYDEYAYRWPAMVDDMLRAAGTEGPFVAGGASMGAAISLYTAARAPRRVQALVLVSPPVAWEERAEEVERYESAAKLVEREGIEPYIRWIQSQPRPRIFAEEMPAVRDIRVRHLRKMDEKVIPAILRGAAASDLPAPEEVRNVIVPTLILAWEGDDRHPASTARRLADLMVMSELHVAESLDDIRQWPSLVHGFLASLCQWESPPASAF